MQIASITSLTPAGGDFIVFITVISYKRTSKWGLKHCIPTFCDWLKITTPLTYPIRVDTENSPRLHGQVFPRLAPAPSTWLEQAVDGKHYSLTFCDWLKSVTPHSYPIKIKLKTIVTYMHKFSRAWSPLYTQGSNFDWLWTDSLRCDRTTTKFALLKWCWLRTAGVSVLRAARAASKMGIASPRSLSHSSLIAWAAAACLLATASSAFTT